CVSLYGGGYFESLTPQAKGQAEAFPFAPDWTDMHDPAGSLAVTTLPQPGGENTYEDQQATRSQMVRTDGNGCVLFFAVDGRLYDHAGYLIADARGDVHGDEDCQQCLEPGVMEMISIPVFGHCGLYYIFSARSGAEPGWSHDWPTRVQVALLDLNATNPWHPDRKGALVYMYDGFPEDTFGITFDVDNQAADISSTYVRWLGWSFKGVSNTPMLRAIDPTGSGEMYWLYVIGTQAVVQYKVDASGVHLLADGMYQEHYQPVHSAWAGMNDKPYYRDAAVTVNANNEVLLAMTDDELQGWSSGSFSSGHGPVLVLRFNATTGTFMGAEEIPYGSGGLPDFGNDNGGSPPPPGPGLTGGPGGIAWVDSGTKLLIQGEAVVNNAWAHRVGIFDLATDQWTDLTSTLNVQDVQDHIYARISGNVESGNLAAYYLPHTAGVSRIGGLPNAPSWTASAPTSDPVALLPFEGYPDDDLYHPYFTNAQVVQDDAYLDGLNDPTCCAVYTAYTGVSGHTFPNIPGTYHWYPDDN
ncbi:MAG TPA: hypothetical protein PL106_12205, partial [Flavobacteriales bacterium]|nr:hypothetical protein [Flavobacteriales bacterium]